MLTSVLVFARGLNTQQSELPKAMYSVRIAACGV